MDTDKPFKKSAVIALPILSILSILIARLPFLHQYIASIIYISLIIASSIFAISTFRSNPFFAATLISIGGFIAIIMDIILFPTVSGFERNLFPIEIVIHTLFSMFVSYSIATLFYLRKTK